MKKFQKQRFNLNFIFKLWKLQPNCVGELKNPAKCFSCHGFSESDQIPVDGTPYSAYIIC